MRYLLSTLFIVVAGLSVLGQDRSEIREGKVSYITTQSVYVRFSSMERISEGDTLYTRHGNEYVPVLRVKNRSSISQLYEDGTLSTTIAKKSFSFSIVNQNQK